MNRTSLAVLFVVVLVGAYVLGSRRTVTAAAAPTYGTILVDTPEVYTRERLVNDRFRQDEWLRQRLAATDDLEFGLQGASSRKRTKELAVGARLDAAPGEGGETPTAEESPPEAVRGSLPGTSVSPIDHFRDLLTYREEVRNEIIQNQLDDRHDLNGNTLYRLKFDLTLIPGPNTRASAVVEVSVEGEFGELALGYEPVGSKRFADGYIDLLELTEGLDTKPSSWFVAEQLDDFRKHLRNIGAIHRTEGMDSRAIGRLEELFEQWRNHLRVDLERRTETFEGELSEKAWKEHRASILDSIVNGIYYASANTTGDTSEIHSALEEQCPGAAAGVDCYRDLLANPPATFLQRVQVSDSRFLPNVDAIVKLLLSARAQEDVVKNASPYLALQLPTADYPEVTADEQMIGISSFGSPYELERFESLMAEVNHEIGIDHEASPFVDVEQGVDSAVISVRSGFLAFVERLLDSQTSIYVYAVTPRESAQRVSSLSEGRDSLQAMIGLGAQVGAAGLESTISHLDQREALIGAIERQPLIVGFGGGESAEVATFGWLLGPRFDVSEQIESGVRFRHVAAQHSLAAIISAPAWWPELRVSIRCCWLDDEGRRLNAEGVEIPGPVEAGEPYSVSLPAGARDLSEVLIGGADIKAKMPEIGKMEPIHLYAGEEASILIPGLHLWRSTVVTLGGQMATGISVLPNMNGIIATFDELDTPANWPADQERYEGSLRLTVWTSEGEDFVDDTVLLYRKPSDPSAEPNLTR